MDLTVDNENSRVYRVVMNGEEQYSLWPVDRSIPPGWIDINRSGTKDQCLAYIKENWTDMRPLSLRQRMDAARHSKAG